MKVSEVYRRAAELLYEVGWTRGAFYTEGVGLCALGAIGVAESGHTVDTALSALRSRRDTVYRWVMNGDIARSWAKQGEDEQGVWLFASSALATFNDHHDTTVDDVAMALLLLAEEAEAEEVALDAVTQRLLEHIKEAEAAGEFVPV